MECSESYSESALYRDKRGGGVQAGHLGSLGRRDEQKGRGRGRECWVLL